MAVALLPPGTEWCLPGQIQGWVTQIVGVSASERLSLQTGDALGTDVNQLLFPTLHQDE